MIKWRVDPSGNLVGRVPYWQGKTISVFRFKVQFWPEGDGTVISISTEKTTFASIIIPINYIIGFSFCVVGIVFPIMISIFIEKILQRHVEDLKSQLLAWQDWVISTVPADTLARPPDLPSGQLAYLQPAIVQSSLAAASAPACNPIDDHSQPNALATKPRVTCRYCGSTINTEVKFCGTCGNLAQPEAVISSGQFPVDYEIAAPARLNEVDAEAVVERIDTSAFQAASSLAFPDQATTNVSMLVQRKALIISGAAALVLIFAAVSSIAAYYYWFSDAAIEQKLDAAITRGDLFKPEGESAYDFYHRLKKNGAEAKSLAPFEERLLPQLTTQPLKLISSFAIPTNREPSPSEWQNALKSMQWASEMRLGDNAINARAKYIEGRIAFISNQKDQALDLWKKASDLDRAWSMPPNGVGIIYNEKKNFEAARKYLFEAIRRESSWAVPYNSIGTSYFFEKNYDDAWSYYMKAVERSPNWARPHAWLGDVAMRRKDFVTAADEYQKALDLAQYGNTALDLNEIRKRLDQARKKSQESAENEIVDEP